MSVVTAIAMEQNLDSDWLRVLFWKNTSEVLSEVSSVESSLNGPNCISLLLLGPEFQTQMK